jgi:cytochrome P450
MTIESGRAVTVLHPDAATTAPGAWPLVGHAPGFLRDRLGTLERAARSGGGGPVRLRLGRDVLLLVDPEDVRHCLVTNARNYVKGEKLASARGRRLQGDTLLTASGERHRSLRLALQPLFRDDASERRAPLFATALEEATSSWQPGVVDVREATMHAARLSIQRALFGHLPDEGAIDADIRERRRFLQRFFASPLPHAERLPTVATPRYRRSRRRLARRVDAVVAERSAERSTANAAPDLVGEMLAAGLEREEVAAHALMLTVPGHETVGDALAWTLDLLARAPDAQEAARRHRAAGDREPLGRAVDESLRLYPPTWLFVRIAVDRDRLPSGAAVRAGGALYISPWILHQDRRWWPDPERFAPERFLREHRSSRPRHAYLPFGAGPRVCIGDRLARVELITALDAILSRWSLEPAGQTPRPRAGLTLEPSGPVLVRLTEL